MQSVGEIDTILASLPGGSDVSAAHPPFPQPLHQTLHQPLSATPVRVIDKSRSSPTTAHLTAYPTAYLTPRPRPPVRVIGPTTLSPYALLPSALSCYRNIMHRAASEHSRPVSPYSPMTLLLALFCIVWSRL